MTHGKSSQGLRSPATQYNHKHLLNEQINKITKTTLQSLHVAMLVCVGNPVLCLCLCLCTGGTTTWPSDYLIVSVIILIFKTSINTHKPIDSIDWLWNHLFVYWPGLIIISAELKNYILQFLISRKCVFNLYVYNVYCVSRPRTDICISTSHVWRTKIKLHIRSFEK